MGEKLSYEEFTKRAIIKLRKGDYKGIHSVYSGFNEAFRRYYPGVNPVDIIGQLVKEKKIVIRPVTGGVMLYLPGDSHGIIEAKEVLKKIGIKKNS